MLVSEANRIIRGIPFEQINDQKTATGAVPTPQACSPAPYSAWII
jgi:hypothetical protein